MCICMSMRRCTDCAHPHRPPHTSTHAICRQSIKRSRPRLRRNQHHTVTISQSRPETRHRGGHDASDRFEFGWRSASHFRRHQVNCAAFVLLYTARFAQYFPLAAVAGCNDVRISIKFRPIKELVLAVPAAPVSDLWSRERVQKQGM